MEGIASAVAEMMPDIAVITEQWSEQGQILEKIRQKTSRAFNKKAVLFKSWREFE